MDEFSIIRRLRELAGPMPDGVETGPGDDAAVMSPVRREGETRLLVSVDAMVEGVHFREGFFTPRALGRRSITIAFSDIAAMGGRPAWAVASCGLPASRWPEERILELARGMKDGLDEAGAPLVGGNLASSDVTFVSVTAGGHCDGTPLTRSGAEAGDLIVLTGTVGGAGIGLDLMKDGKRHGDHPLIDRYTNPPSRIKEGISLLRIARACIDISDGLLQDLGHVLEGSGVGAELYADRIPLPDAGGLFLSGDDLLDAALTGGEDYELLAAVPPGKTDELDALRAETGTSFSIIGTFIAGEGRIDIRGPDGKKIRAPAAGGWNHFKPAEGSRTHTEGTK